MVRGVLMEAHVYESESGARSRRNLLLSCLVNNTIINLTSGAYLAGFCLAIGGNSSYINLLALITALSNIVQLFAAVFWERVQQRKKPLMIVRGLAHAINLIAIPLLTLSGLKGTELSVAIAVLFTLVQILMAILTPGVQTWHIGCIPLEKRLGYFCFFNVVLCVAMYMALFAAGVLADFLVGMLGQGIAMPLLRIISISLAVMDLIFLSRIKEYPYSDPPSKPSILSVFSDIRKYTSYLKIIAVASIWSFCMGIPSQYYNIYLLDVVKMNYSFFNALNLLNVVAVLLFTSPWKKIINARQLRGGLFWGLILYAPYTIGMFFTTARHIFIYPIALLYGFIFAVGTGICFTMMPYTSLPEKNRTIFMALYNTCCAAATFLGVFFGRIVFGLFSRAAPVWQGEALDPARLLMLVYGVVLVIAAWMIRWMLTERANLNQTENQGLQP